MKTIFSLGLALITIGIFSDTTLFAQPKDVSGIIINEVYFNITAVKNGNWNGGGSSAATDQFIELYNTTDTDIDLGAWMIANGTTFSFRFKDSTILPGQRSLVLAKVIGTHVPPPGHLALSTDNAGFLAGSFLMGTASDCIFLINPGPGKTIGDPPADDVWMTFSYGGAARASGPFNSRPPNGADKGNETDSKTCSGESINRDPDMTGTTWEKHLVLNSSNACSPNKKFDNSSPLPIEFISFRADLHQDAKQIILRWTTSSNLYNAGFAIERRSNLQSAWERRGYVANFYDSNSYSEYAYTDPIAPTDEAKYFYRLHQFDVDGSNSFSPVLAVEMKPQSEFFSISNYPNPFGENTINSSTTILLQTPNSMLGKYASVKVFDQLGREIKTLFEGAIESQTILLPFNAASNPGGNYFCRVQIAGRTILHRLQYVR